MGKKVIKIIGIILICITIMNVAMLGTNKSLALTDVTENPGSWQPSEDSQDEDIINEKLGPVLKIIRNIGIISSVITLSIIGLKIMFSSAEGKAAYKQTLLPWVIGAFMVFSMTTIPSLIYDLTYTGRTSGTNSGTTGGGGSGLGGSELDSEIRENYFDN